MPTLINAVAVGVADCYLNSGQPCSALTRMLVSRVKLSEAEQIAKWVAESFAVGDPFGESTRVGPVVSEVQHARVRGYIEQGIAEGARPITGVHRRRANSPGMTPLRAVGLML